MIAVTSKLIYINGFLMNQPISCFVCVCVFLCVCNCLHSSGDIQVIQSFSRAGQKIKCLMIDGELSQVVGGRWFFLKFLGISTFWGFSWLFGFREFSLFKFVFG